MCNSNIKQIFNQINLRINSYFLDNQCIYNHNLTLSHKTIFLKMNRLKSISLIFAFKLYFNDYHQLLINKLLSRNSK